MSYPQFTDFSEALQNPRGHFSDPELQSAEAETNGLGLPTALGGGFTYTFPMTTLSGSKLAVRCFHRHVPSAEHRYAAISEKLNALASPHFVKFQYQPSGIRIRGSAYPIVRMSWVDGDTLGVFLERRANNSAVISNLRASFRSLAAHLERAGIAHGDIQNLNIIVVGGELRLIDYDGMYVPPLALGAGEEVGHKHWQHPLREASDFGPNMDRFSFIAVDLSLQALTIDPSLLKQFSAGGETIIFKANDYADPGSSEIFRILYSKPELRAAAANFQRICEASSKQVPTLEEFLSGVNIPAERSRSTRPAPQSEEEKKRARYISPYPVVSAFDFQSVLGHSGNRVELVGQILSVKHGIGKRGKGKNKPYVFVNFGAPWNSNIVKLTAWSDGLASMTEPPSEAWIGRWVSVTGLIDVPYEGKHFGKPYTHVGITLTAQNQVLQISAADAKYRLGEGSARKTAAPTKNQGILIDLGVAQVKQNSKGPTASKAGKISSTSKSPNQQILVNLKSTHTQSNSAPPTPSSNRPSPSNASGNGVPGWVWVLGLILAFIVIGRLGK